MRRGDHRAAPVLVVCGLVVGALLLPAARAGREAGPEVRVSNLPDPQNEPTIAIDPSNDRILLAGSNSFSEGTMRVYSSIDGGLTWTADAVYPKPESREQTCAADPGVAVDLNGRQYYSFVRSTPCGTGPPRLFVASRPGPDAEWSNPVQVASLGRARFDDKPALAADVSPSSPYRNRAYVAWSRISRVGVFSLLLSHSDDGGRTWSRPVKVNSTGRELSYASVAIGRKGTVYVAWDDISNFHIKIARSIDGGGHFEEEQTVAAFSIVTIPHCGSGIVIPAQRLTCVHANPIVSVDRSRGRYAGRVYVTYAQTEFFGSEGARVAILNNKLRTLAGYPLTRFGVAIAPQDRGRRGDQFWPASAVDASTGALWVCFYDTRGDRKRKKAVYSCTSSRNGGRKFAPPVRAASVPSDETQPNADPREYGDYEGLAVANGVAHPIWTDSRDLATLGEEIYTTILTPADLGPRPPSR
ncbi:MAG: exo-alpha-sialidase [Actinobacteria bacterium]|nr:exo-alpha-sialidase [Actinomycetota bacterium]